MGSKVNILRTFFAYTLLTVMALQWVMGNLYLKMTFVQEISHEMDQTEKAIANVLIDEYGFLVHVNTIDDQDIEFIQGLGYAAPFIHSVEIDGSTSAFTLGSMAPDFESVSLDVSIPDSSQKEKHQGISIEKLFSQFCPGESTSVQNEKPNSLTEKNFSVVPLHNIGIVSNPSPPPKVV